MLEDQRLLSRVHGGAVTHGVLYELPVRYRGGQRLEEKRRIAALAASRLPKGLLVLGLTGGTTTSEVAHCVSGRVDLTVITNALNIAMGLANRPRLTVVLTGGVARAQSYELVGKLAEQSLSRFSIDVAVVGVDGVSTEGGLTTHDEVEARTNAAMIAQSRRVIVVADGSKVGRAVPAQMATLEAVTELVTDGSAPPDSLRAISAAGVEVHVA
jgi:DeoR family transcriptional regulator of aga operon